MVIHKCDNCEKEFKQKSSLQRHLLNKTPCKKSVVQDNTVKKQTTDIIQDTTGRKLNVIDLFCGCGGMSKGLTDAGMHIVGGIDVWDKAINSYSMNFEHNAICEDLTTFPPEKFDELYNKSNIDIDLLVGGPPCFLAGTKVLTQNGYANIESVLLEDKLMTHTGTFQNIVNLQRKIYHDELYELKLKYHYNTINCTKEHPFYVREKKMNWNYKLKKYDYSYNKPQWKKANELTHNDYVGMVINTNEIIPIFLKKYELLQNLDDKEYWYKIGYYIGKKWKNENFTEQEYVVGISGLFGKNDCDKFIPEWVQDAPIEFIQEFINGYTTTNRNIETESYNFALGLQRLYLKLEHMVGIKKNIKANKVIYTIIQTETTSFIEDNYAWYYISKITIGKIVNEVEVYNFEVENDNSYIVENAIVHNCQGFSIAGKRNQNDPRNSLFMEYVKYLNFYNPKAFIMENVMGILSMKTENNESVIDIILSQLQRNYNCIVCKLYASDFEVPQNRRRIIIFGLRKNLNIIPTEPEIINKTKNDRNPVKNVLLRREDVEASHYLSPKAITGIINKKQKSLLNKNGFGAQFLDMDKPSYTIPARYWKDGCDALVKYSDTEIRRLTIIELKRIQTFPDDYIILGSKKDIIMQIGNAVACRFAYHLGIHVIKTLRA